MEDYKRDGKYLSTEQEDLLNKLSKSLAGKESEVMKSILTTEKQLKNRRHDRRLKNKISARRKAAEKRPSGSAGVSAPPRFCFPYIA